MARIKPEDKINLIREYKVVSKFPIFSYQSCHCCHDKVVRERMWRFHETWLSIGCYFPGYYDQYLCKTCAPTKVDAAEYARSQEERFKSGVTRPKAPAAPPPPLTRFVRADIRPECPPPPPPEGPQVRVVRDCGY